MVRGDGGLSQPLAADPVDRHVYPDRSTTDRQHTCLLNASLRIIFARSESGCSQELFYAAGHR